MTDELDPKDKRIAELAEMLNNAHQAALIQVEDERDSCARTLSSMLEVELDVEPSNTERVLAFSQALEAIQARKHPHVRFIGEMAHGTMISEYIKQCIDNFKTRLREEVQKSHPELRNALEELLGDS